MSFFFHHISAFDIILQKPITTRRVYDTIGLLAEEEKRREGGRGGCLAFVSIEGSQHAVMQAPRSVFLLSSFFFLHVFVIFSTLCEGWGSIFNDKIGWYRRSWLG